MQEKGYYNRVVSGNISQRIEVDSVVCDFNAILPGHDLCPANDCPREQHHRAFAGHALRADQLGASDNNPQGFIMEKFEILENRDLRTLKR